MVTPNDKATWTMLTEYCSAHPSTQEEQPMRTRNIVPTNSAINIRQMSRFLENSLQPSIERIFSQMAMKWPEEIEWKKLERQTRKKGNSPKGTLFNWHLLSSRSRNSLNGRGKSPGRFWGVPWRQLPKSSWTCCSWISAARAFSFLHSEALRNSGLVSFPEQIPATNQLCMNSTFKICRYFWEAFSCRLIPINDAGLPLDTVFVGNEFMSVIFCRSESCAVDYESDSRQQVVAMQSADADRTTGLGGKKRPSFNRGRKFFFF